MNGAHLFPDNHNLTIYFNNSVILTGEFDIYKAITVSIEGPYKPYNMDWYLENSDAYYSGVPTKEFALVMDFKGI